MIAIPPSSEAGKLLESNPLLLFQEVEVFWESSPLPTTFFFPCLIVSVTKKHDWPDFVTDVRQVRQRTVGALKFADCFVDLLENFVHPSLREFLERPLFNKFQAIVDSEQFKYDHRRFLSWIEELSDPRERIARIKLAKTTSGKQIV